MPYNLDNYKCKIKVAGEPLGFYIAYSMDAEDGKSCHDLRKDAGFGTCHICDYFYPTTNSIVLIEETNLSSKYEKLQEDCGYLKNNEFTEYFRRLTVQECQLKVYGSLLILYHLARQLSECEVGNRKYDFFLIASGRSNPGVEKTFIHLTSTLKPTLRGILSKSKCGEVKVISGENICALGKILSQYQCPPPR